MPYKPRRSVIERIAEAAGVIPKLSAGENGLENPLYVDGLETRPTHGELETRPTHNGVETRLTNGGVEPPPTSPAELRRFPGPEEWHDHVEYSAAGGSKLTKPRHYRLVPTTCFNCESACGLLAYVDKESGAIKKLEGNPVHPGSRGKNCAKGPATINQVNDPDRILAPMKRVGPRGGGGWQAVSWDEALKDIGGRIRRALVENRRDEIVYHVGRPGAEGFIDRVLRAWGVDGHNSHTNICSSGARLGYALWSGYDRPSPDYANARFILALNAHLESGHYFNPHAQRISEGLSRGAKMAVVDPRLSNTASLASFWLPCVPGTESALILAFAHVILRENLVDRAYVERWVNWRESIAHVGMWEGGNVGTEERPRSHVPTFPLSHALTVDDFFAALTHLYRGFTPEFAEAECGVPADTIVKVARLIGEAGSRFCSHTWRGSASAHLGGWQVSRCLMLLHALTGSFGTEGGCLPAGWNKYKASLINVPPPQNHWNELHWPREFPLTHYEMSHLLPHFLKDGRGRIDTYFTRVFNPVWTYPDGFTWIEALRDESKIGLHVALTPTWNETAFYADYVLPMGHGPERHDLNTYETHSGTWIAFRQPVLRAAAQAEGQQVRDTRDVNPGQVWEEDEFWIALCWAIDPDGSLGIRKYFESAKQPGQMLGVDEYYEHAFDRVPGLPEAAKSAGLTTLDYMRKFGAFEVKPKEYSRQERRLSLTELEGSTVDPATGVVSKHGHAIGVVPQPDSAVSHSAVARFTQAAKVEGMAAFSPDAPPVEGFPTPSRKLEFFSKTMVDWGWPEYAIPGYIRSHVWDAVPLGDDAGSAARNPQSAIPNPQSIRNPKSEIRNPSGTSNAADAGQSKIENRKSKMENGDFCLLPTFRLPTLIHTRSGAAKWLNEISQRNPIWIHTSDARRMKLRTGDLVRVSTRIGYFVDKVWVTEGIRPGVVACSHHLGRWRRPTDPPNSRWSASTVVIEELDERGAVILPLNGVTSPSDDQFKIQNPKSKIGPAAGGRWRIRVLSGPQPFDSPDPDSRRIWWRDGGVHQNITFPVHPDPISGMHCWHQRVRVEPAHPGDQSGDVFVDTNKSMEVYREWMAKTRWPVGPPPGPDGKRLRRPTWLNRPLRPTDAAYCVEG